MSAQRRIRHGLARTFQKIRLFKQLSALENVIAGYHTRHVIPSWQYLFHGAAFREDARQCREEAIELLNFVGLKHRAHITAGALAYGEQRLLEIARALATAPRLLMVEHNMDLVMNVADRILVMDYGQQLFAGPPADVQAHPDVIAAYLGANVL